MQAYVIKQLLLAILSTASEPLAKAIADAVLDVAEDYVKTSENKIDDKIVLPLINQLRVAYELNDED